MSSSHPAATIKFFNADCSDSGSESESPPLQERYGIILSTFAVLHKISHVVALVPDG